jgi:three-Cys-motif partner protein
LEGTFKLIALSEPLQQFGGDWTNKKLASVRDYLIAYQNALKNQPFTLYYIDAFAGTGYNAPKADDDRTSPLFAELLAPETRQFVDGSARIALQIPQPFDRYIFIERNPERHSELLKLKAEFPQLADRIEPANEEANTFLTSFCQSKNWLRDDCRAVVFLDPFGMQVTWTTIQAIAATKAIDLWLLFPLGIGVMRMLPNHGQIPPGWRKTLDRMFGESTWYDAFYGKVQTFDLFSSSPTDVTVKRADYDSISRYFVERLKSVFPHVADNPLPLHNSSNCPLYLLCFAAANPGKGGAIAKRIAGHILKS